MGKWIMQGGRLRIEGESVDNSEEIKDGNTGPDEVFDGAGNKIEVNKAAVMTDKDRKKQIKDLEKKLKEARRRRPCLTRRCGRLRTSLTSSRRPSPSEQFVMASMVAVLVRSTTTMGFPVVLAGLARKSS